jgi:pyruvate dehydrogenase E2 component (dihydrolipoamide acetyltransferase)
MPVNVVMPQMGESVTEGTVVRWIRKVGDHVDRDEPLFEISTDKVDAEIPSPAAGTLAAIHVKEGETVPVDALVAVIAQAGESVEAGPQPDGVPAKTAAVVPAATAVGAPTAPPSDRGAATVAASRAASSPAPPEAAAASRAEAGEPLRREGGDTEGGPSRAEAGAIQGRDGGRLRSSPLVRRIASEHHVDIGSIPGSGIGGRVTKHDILSAIESGAASTAPRSAERAEAAEGTRGREGGPGPVGEGGPIGGPAPAFADGERTAVAPFSVMRKKIAEHMVLSQRTAAHVHSVFEVDFTHVDRLRQAKKAEYERAGLKLTYLSFIARAVVDSLQQAPILNASHKGDTVIYSRDVNLGIAVALDWGLIVPVIHRAHEMDLRELSRGIADLATRARAKQLKNEEVHGGTFTITNPGTLGAQFGMPIINQPQLAILGVGTIEKRPVVIDDGIAIRLRSYLTLGFDHRLIDGIVADRFMALVKDRIERFDAAAV